MAVERDGNVGVAQDGDWAAIADKAELIAGVVVRAAEPPILVG